MARKVKAKKSLTNVGKNSQNTFPIVFIIAVAILLGIYLIKSNLASLTNQPASQPTAPSTSISSDKDLLNSYQDLNSTNIDNSIDPQLQQSNSDAQGLQ